MLSAKRVGSTAVMRMMRKHPGVGITHPDPEIGVWEPNWWNMAADAIAGKDERFYERNAEHLPFLEIPQPLTEEAAFDLWDQVIDRFGPVVFDKSPQYLDHRPGIELLQRYIERGNDVRLFGFVRDPRDAITSQWVHWRKVHPEGTIAVRTKAWLKKYRHLDELQQTLGPIPVFRYEDFAAAPDCYAPMLLRHVGLKVVPDCWSHIRPVSVGRHRRLAPWRKGPWRDPLFRAHLRRHGYLLPPRTAERWLKDVIKEIIRKP